MQTKPIAVLHLIKSLGRGGAETLLPETLRIHDKNIFVFHCIYFLPWKNQLADEIIAAGGIVKNIPAVNNIRILLQAFRIARYLKDNKIQLIHCHLPWAGFVGRIVHLISGVPVIYTEHNKQERYQFITRLLNKWSFNFQSLVIAVSEDVKYSIQKNIKPSIPVQTILNGINTAKFHRNTDAGKRIRAELGIPVDAIVIGSLGVFRTQKRINYWLELFRKASTLNPSIRGILVGDGPLKLEIISQIKDLGLEDLVFLPGLQTNAVDWYSAMDIFMMTSSFEGLPLALLEAMSCECAVVSTNAGGISEVIENDISGIVVDVDLWKKLAFKVQFLLDNPDIRTRMGLAARRRVVNHFSIESMVNQLQTTYHYYVHTEKH